MSSSSSRTSSFPTSPSSKKEQNILNALARLNLPSNELSVSQIALEEGCDASTVYKRLRRTNTSLIDAIGRRQKLSPELEQIVLQQIYT